MIIVFERASNGVSERSHPSQLWELTASCRRHNQQRGRLHKSVNGPETTKNWREQE